MRRPLAIAVLLTSLVLLSGCASLLDQAQGGPRALDYGPSAAFLVWEDPYPELVVEVDYAASLEDRGRAPTQHALGILEDTLADVTDKRSIRIEGPNPIDVGDGSASRTWTSEQVSDVEARTVGGEARGSGETYRLHILYLNGHREDGAIAGYSVGPWLVLFPDAYDVTNQLPLGLPLTERPGLENIERSVLVHEVGHSLGLVDNGAPMQSARLAEGDDCRCHSENEDSVMYPFVRNQRALLEYLQDNRWTPYRFDQQDLADLAALREAGRQGA